uniref:Uncharacterized protein n=1 Tax=Glossina pallidipes TaxID=7398 RepID=A0A1A9Z5B6_GLOPL
MFPTNCLAQRKECIVVTSPEPTRFSSSNIASSSSVRLANILPISLSTFTETLGVGPLPAADIADEPLIPAFTAGVAMALGSIFVSLLVSSLIPKPGNDGALSAATGGYCKLCKAVKTKSNKNENGEEEEEEEEEEIKLELSKTVPAATPTPVAFAAELLTPPAFVPATKPARSRVFHVSRKQSIYCFVHLRYCPHLLMICITTGIPFTADNVFNAFYGNQPRKPVPSQTTHTRTYSIQHISHFKATTTTNHKSYLMLQVL